MLKIVLDTSVLVSGFRSRNGASFRLLGLVAQRRVIPLASTSLFLEYEAVLKRPEQRAISGLSLAQVNSALAALAAAIQPVEVHFAWRPQLSDPDDEMVLEAAVNGGADAIVTHNRMDFVPAAASFGVMVLSPGELLPRVVE